MSSDDRSQEKGYLGGLIKVDFLWIAVAGCFLWLVGSAWETLSFLLASFPALAHAENEIRRYVMDAVWYVKVLAFLFFYPSELLRVTLPVTLLNRHRLHASVTCPLPDAGSYRIRLTFCMRVRPSASRRST
jgi:hypothetical protein